MNRSAFFLLAGCLGSCGGSASRPGLPSAVLITLDTTRWDAPSCYGRTTAVTPAIDRLAAEGVLYEAAYTVAPITLPAHASMLTGLYPIRHTVRENGLWPLPAEADTLAELARGNGIQTAAFVAAAVLDPRFGLDQGFDLYDAPRRPAVEVTTYPAQRRAAEIADRAIEWLRARDDERPFFLWLHLFDPHGPLDPPTEFRRGPLKNQPYLGEVAAADHAVGRVIEELRESGAMASTLIAVVADHGEAFGDHGEPGHGAFVYEATLRVPLVLRYPDGFRAGEREPRVASVVDIFATLAEALGLSVSGEVDGRSLYRRRVPADRGAYFESYMGYLSFGWSPLAGWVDGEGKYLHSSEPEFFDVRRDPGEERNLLQHGADVESYRAAMEEVTARRRLRADTSRPFDAALLADVRALGYAASGDPRAELPDPLDAGDFPSPQSRAAAHRDLLRGMDLANRGELAEAGVILRSVVDGNPRNAVALDRLADCRKRQGRHAEAVELFQMLLKQRPEWSHSLFGLGICLMETERHEEALRAFRRALTIDPAVERTVEAMLATLRRRGQAGLAHRYERGLLEGALTDKPD